MAASAVEDFYRGKTLTIVVGSTPGGGYDNYARLLARHLGPHIPGNPAVSVQNMPGASTSVAAVYMYNVAPRDGLSMVAVTAGALMEPLLGDQVQSRINPQKFNYIGSATTDVYVCVARRDSGVRKFEDVLQRELVVGAAAEGGSARDFPQLLNRAIGAKFKIISGYPGNRETTLAVDRGEVSGVCGNSFGGLHALRPEWFAADSPVNVIVQESMTGHPELNQRGVPLAISYAKSDEQRSMLQLLYGELLFSRPFAMPPDTPSERVVAIRRAVADSFADPELLADAQKVNLEVVEPASGSEVQSIIARLYATDPDIVARTRAALKQ